MAITPTQQYQSLFYQGIEGLKKIRAPNHPADKAMEACAPHFPRELVALVVDYFKEEDPSDKILSRIAPLITLFISQSDEIAPQFEARTNFGLQGKANESLVFTRDVVVEAQYLGPQGSFMVAIDLKTQSVFMTLQTRVAFRNLKALPENNQQRAVN